MEAEDNERCQEMTWI